MSNSQVSRPLSPHVGIYRWQITNTLSILHRMTGVALSIGTLFLVAWLWAAAYNGQTFHMWQEFFAGPVGIFMLFGWSVAFYYHLGNGIRHLVWDTGRGFDLDTVTKTGLFNLAFTAVATAITWFVAGNQLMGGAS